LFADSRLGNLFNMMNIGCYNKRRLIIKLLPINSHAPRYLPCMAVIIAPAIGLPISVAKLTTIKFIPI
jgi:hypothetical protein